MQEVKQGLTIPVSHAFEIRCRHCKALLADESNYMAHLRDAHKYTSEEDIEIAINEPRIQYEIGLHHLETLLHEYTDYTLATR